MLVSINCLVSFERRELRKYQKRWFLANRTSTKPTGEPHDSITLIPLACLLTLSCFWLFCFFHSSFSWSAWPSAQPQMTQSWSWGLHPSEHHEVVCLSWRLGFFCLLETFLPPPWVQQDSLPRQQWEGQRGFNPFLPCKPSGSPPAPALTDTSRSGAHSASQAELF